MAAIIHYESIATMKRVEYLMGEGRTFFEAVGIAAREAKDRQHRTARACRAAHLRDALEYVEGYLAKTRLPDRDSLLASVRQALKRDDAER